MRVLIMGRDGVAKHLPTKPTYCIRIFNSWDREGDKWARPPLKESPNWRTVREYVFDDADEIYRNPCENPIVINEEMARRIVKDFIDGREGCSELLVHCSRGKSRSPALALALGEVFGLDLDVEKVREEGVMLINRLVYRLVKEAAGKQLNK